MLLIKILLSPPVFAAGFLWPLTHEVILRMSLMPTGWQSWVVSAGIVLPFALMAHFRGSWIWIK
ncbi:MAG: hypothetical protein HN856_05360 [Gammaproteobacteria bacterium]|jgi:hypothetical protein|nr:hypothetical protein [Gammaproteobacteria bacterium]